MRRQLSRWLLGWLLCGMWLATTWAGEAPPQPAALPTPLDLGSKEISAALIISDINGLLENAEAIAKSVAPDKVQPGMLKAIAGMPLGDPQLANLGAQPIVLFLFTAPEAAQPPTDPPPFALFIPAKAAAPYDQALAKAGLQTAFEDGLLLAALTPDVLAKAKAEKAAYQKVAAAGLKSQFTICCDVSALMTTYGALLRNLSAQALQKMSQVPVPPNAAGNPQNIQKILGLEFKVLLGLLNQTATVQYDVKLQPEALQVEQLYVAKPGSTMAGLLTAPAAGKSKALEALTNIGTGVMGGVARFNPVGLSAFINQLSEKFKKDPDLANLVNDDTLAQIKLIAESQGGEMAFSLGSGDKVFGEIQTALAVSNQEKFLAVIEGFSKLMGPAGALGQFYADMGMKFAPKFEKNVRQHAGTQVNRMNMEMDFTNFPAPNAAAMQQMIPKVQESAFANGLYLQAGSPAALDAMLDRVLAKTPDKPAVVLQAMKTFGDSKDFYLDYDFVGLMKVMSVMDPNNPMQMIFGQLTAGEPIVFAGSLADGRLFMQGKYPLLPFINMAKSFMQMMPANQPQPPPAPPNQPF